MTHTIERMNEIVKVSKQVQELEAERKLLVDRIQSLKAYQTKIQRDYNNMRDEK